MPSSFHSTDARSEASDRVGHARRRSRRASAGPDGRARGRPRRVLRCRARSRSPPSRGRSPDSMRARRTRSAGTAAAFAIASAISPADAPCRSSPVKSLRMKPDSASVARPNSVGEKLAAPGGGSAARRLLDGGDGTIEVADCQRRLPSPVGRRCRTSCGSRHRRGPGAARRRAVRPRSAPRPRRARAATRPTARSSPTASSSTRPAPRRRRHRRAASSELKPDVTGAERLRQRPVRRRSLRSAIERAGSTSCARANASGSPGSGGRHQHVGGPAPCGQSAASTGPATSAGEAGDRGVSSSALPSGPPVEDEVRRRPVAVVRARSSTIQAPQHGRRDEDPGARRRSMRGAHERHAAPQPPSPRRSTAARARARARICDVGASTPCSAARERAQLLRRRAASRTARAAARRG